MQSLDNKEAADKSGEAPTRLLATVNTTQGQALQHLTTSALHACSVSAYMARIMSGSWTHFLWGPLTSGCTDDCDPALWHIIASLLLSVWGWQARAPQLAANIIGCITPVPESKPACNHKAQTTLSLAGCIYRSLKLKIVAVTLLPSLPTVTDTVTVLG